MLFASPPGTSFFSHELLLVRNLKTDNGRACRVSGISDGQSIFDDPSISNGFFGIPCNCSPMSSETPFATPLIGGHYPVLQKTPSTKEISGQEQCSCDRDWDGGAGKAGVPDY
jgi:hypothetical protein